ncbi:helix-turn-helix domain-containing protein [Oculatella sp. LEGE 06141]|uniref:helix-turn-helix domain-containing protein n=1 Tax=Oculatella sp. LEGE 06141 TaxID=1828648 RepID=UPI001D153259|nr:helix-turn-helix domain-containing protein [Oculatella sp. LEGE 06141]
MTSMYCLEGAENTKITISQEGLRHICRQAEAELYHSEVYQRTLAELQRGLSEAAEGCQNLIRAFAREAIRLAVRQLVRQHRVNVMTSATEPSPVLTDRPSLNIASMPSVQSIPAPNANLTIAKSTVSEDDATATVKESQSAAPPDEVTQSTSLPVQPPPAPSRLRKWSRADAVAAIDQERDSMLRLIGQEFKRVRETRSLSLEQLHTQTWVPLHQLKALEAGQVDQLPEDIYVRGFIKRVGDALKLNGAEIAAGIPVPERAKTVVPSWQRSVGSAKSLSPVHLYVGYAALMAGAVGGLTWMSSQAASEGAHHISSPDSAPEVAQPSQKADLGTVQSSSAGGSTTTPDVIPPESLPF